MELAGESAWTEQSNNPAQVVVAAHLAAQSTRGDMDLRKKSKWRLTRSLYERGYSRQEVLELFRLIDWLLNLPEGLDIEFERELIKFEEENVMPYITSIERIGRQEGRQEALREGILDILEARFGVLPEELRVKILEITGQSQLKGLHRRAALMASLGEFSQAIGGIEAG